MDQMTSACGEENKLLAMVCQVYLQPRLMKILKHELTSKLLFFCFLFLCHDYFFIVDCSQQR
jgi:hypothetical protein